MPGGPVRQRGVSQLHALTAYISDQTHDAGLYGIETGPIIAWWVCSRASWRLPAVSFDSIAS
jgi:hypothetical protein